MVNFSYNSTCLGQNNKFMRIAFFHNLPVGGAKKVVYEQIKYLSSKHEIDLFYLNNDDQLTSIKKYITDIYSYEVEINNSRRGFISRLQKDFNNFFHLRLTHKKIAKKIDENNYDIVIIHPDKYTQAPFLLRYLTTKNIYYCHEWLRIVYEDEYLFKEKVALYKKVYEEFTRRIRKYIDKKNTKAATYIVANSNFTANNIKKAYQRNAAVCYPGVDSKLFAPKKTFKKYDLLFIGEKTQTEGFELLTEIKKKLSSKVNIKIISKKNETFSFSDTMLAKEYNCAKLVVCLSVNEPFGLIPLEAMACGVPVVAVSDGGYRETVIDGKTGYLVSRDPRVLAQKLDFLLSHRKKREELGKNARSIIEKKWTWGKSIESLEKIFSVV